MIPRSGGGSDGAAARASRLTYFTSGQSPSVHRPEGLVGRDRGADLVVVARALRLGRLLHLEQVGRVDLAAVGADRALAEQRVVGRHRLHLRDDLGAVVGLGGLDRLQVVQHRRVHAGLHHRRVLAAVGLRAKRLRPGAGLVVQVPVEGLGEDQALRGLQAQRVDVGDEHQQAGEVLAALDDAELGRLLDRVDGVAAGVGQADDLGLGRLRLQQEGREVRGPGTDGAPCRAPCRRPSAPRPRCRAPARGRRRSRRSGRTSCRRRS